MTKKLSREAMEKIDAMVERVARKAGYTGNENMTYKELLQAKFEQERQNISQEISKFRSKFSRKPSNTDFAEEIKTYLKDGLIDLMNEGYSEEEAVKITMDKFDEAELNDTFNEFVQAMGGFDMEEFTEPAARYKYRYDEAIGLFYGGFVILGTALGTFLGYILGQTVVNTLIGFGLGLFVGVSMGLITNAIIALKRKEQ